MGESKKKSETTFMRETKREGGREEILHIAVGKWVCWLI